MRPSLPLLIILGLLFFFTANAQRDSTGFDFFPKSTYFEVVLLDPNEDQISTGVYKLWKNQGQPNSGFYIPANIGFQQSFIRYVRNAYSGIEIGMSVGVFAQFGIEKIEKDQVLAEMINTDYKATLFFNYRIKKIDMRLRLFHISSHLSDDYIYRNNITEPNIGTRNYEQIDFATSYQIRTWRVYGGLGMVITPNAIRERFSSQLGFLYRGINEKRPNFSPVWGMDMQILAENNYDPGIRTGVGIELGNPEKTHIGFMLEYYHGNIPYGTIDYGMVQWFGISTRLLPPRMP